MKIQSIKKGFIVITLAGIFGWSHAEVVATWEEDGVTPPTWTDSSAVDVSVSSSGWNQFYAGTWGSMDGSFGSLSTGST